MIVQFDIDRNVISTVRETHELIITEWMSYALKGEKINAIKALRDYGGIDDNDMKWGRK